MKRTPKAPKRKRAHQRKKRTKNPAFNPPAGWGKLPEFPIPAGSKLEIDIHAPEFDGMTGIAADMMIRAALIGATDEEKMLIAVLIPVALKFIRGAKDKPGEATKTPPGRTDGPETKTEAE